MRKRRLLRIRNIILLPVLAMLPFLCARLAFLRPATDREWTPQHSVAPEIRFDGDQVHVKNIRNFAYRGADEYETAYYDRSFDLNSIESLWFVLSPFRDNWRGPAHSFLSFGFADSQYVAISVEARKEIGEDYSVWKGLVNSYELMYVIGDERDLIGLRAVHWRDPVYVYPIRTTQQNICALFVAMLQRTNKLAGDPEFYNTVTNNCTSNLYDHVKQLAPDKWSYSWKLQLPGYADELLLDMDIVDTDLPVAEARARFLVNEQALRFRDDPRFSVRIRHPPRGI